MLQTRFRIATPGSSSESPSSVLPRFQCASIAIGALFVSPRSCSRRLEPAPKKTRPRPAKRRSRRARCEGCRNDAEAATTRGHPLDLRGRMAKATGLAVSTVQGIWKSHGLAPHRWRSFKLSNDPALRRESFTPLLGSTSHRFAHAVVLSFEREVPDPGRLTAHSRACRSRRAAARP